METDVPPPAPAVDATCINRQFNELSVSDSSSKPAEPATTDTKKKEPSKKELRMLARQQVFALDLDDCLQSFSRCSLAACRRRRPKQRLKTQPIRTDMRMRLWFNLKLLRGVYLQGIARTPWGLHLPSYFYLGISWSLSVCPLLPLLLLRYHLLLFFCFNY